jgi:sugar (pentulose or hexulose) kinase
VDFNETYLGIELGSTRIKAVLIDKNHSVIASGSHTWENEFDSGIWTYKLNDIWSGIRDCYAKLNADVLEKYGAALKKVAAIGISAMMHGYMAFDESDNLLVPFRTWRNTITEEASKRLTKLFDFQIPQRWSISHLYQTIINNEQHVKEITYLTTLAGYIHWKLTGKKVLGIGDASGMFPIDDTTKQYDRVMLKKFDEQTADMPWTIEEILPKILFAGENAGALTEKGAALLDPTGKLQAGIPMCPPEGDAGTGMVATNSVRQRTANISAGTSVFAMVVLEKALSKVHDEIDLVSTPAGDAVGMVHCNNCLGDQDAWIELLGEAAAMLGAEFDKDKLYSTLVGSVRYADKDCGGLLSYNYISGEHITHFEQGRPLFIRTPNAQLSVANMMRTNMYSACASLRIGMRILFDYEGVALDTITGHGGYFKVSDVGQRIMAAAMGAPVTVMTTASEGGPWGIAILAAYMADSQDKTLPDYLSEIVFLDSDSTTVEPDGVDVGGFNAFMKRYEAGLGIERAAVETI